MDSSDKIEAKKGEDVDDSVHFGEVIGQMKQDLGYFGGVLGARLGGAWAALQIEDTDDEEDDNEASTQNPAKSVPPPTAPFETNRSSSLTRAGTSGSGTGGLGMLTSVGKSALKILRTEEGESDAATADAPRQAPSTAKEESDQDEPENEFEENFDEQGGADNVKELERRRGLALRKIREIDASIVKDQKDDPGSKRPTEKISSQIDSVLKVAAAKEEVDKIQQCADIREFGAKARAKASKQAEEYQQSMLAGDQDQFVEADPIEACCASCRARMDKLKSEASTILAILVADVVSSVMAFAEDEEDDWLPRGKGARAVTDVGRAEANEVSLIFVAFLDKIVEATATRVASLQNDAGDGADVTVMHDLERRRDKIHSTMVQATTSSSVKLRQCLASITPILRLRALQDFVPASES